MYYKITRTYNYGKVMPFIMHNNNETMKYVDKYMNEYIGIDKPFKIKVNSTFHSALSDTIFIYIAVTTSDNKHLAVSLGVTKISEEEYAELLLD